MSTMRDLIATIARLAAVPTIQPLAEAAQRAATKTSSQLAFDGVPMRAVVERGATRVSVRLVQYGPLTRPFGAFGPKELLRKNIETELPQASAEYINRILGAVR